MDTLYIITNQYGMDSQCIKMDYLGFEVSICCERSPVKLAVYGKTDCRIYKGQEDVTHLFFEDQDNYNVGLEDLFHIKQKIDNYKK